MRVALVNTNRIQPPIAPIGLDYSSEALNAAGHQVQLLDLCWEDDPHSAIAAFFNDADYGLVGVTLRNTDDCAFTSRQSFLTDFAGMVETIKLHTDAFVVLGGVGFSVMPGQCLGLTSAEAGIWGESEFVLPELATRLESKQEWCSLPSLIWRRDESIQHNLPSAQSLDALPHMSRSWVDNRRYFRHGGQAGFETKRGCPCKCIYCADPLAKGRTSRIRPPVAVVDEIENLLEQGIDHLHTCDGEFNEPSWHALEVCEEIVRRGLGGRLRWYAYCSPAHYSAKLAGAMREAGCAGVNFGVDNGDADMLKRLGRNFAPDDIMNAVKWSQQEGMAVMLDLLLGSPGESAGSIVGTVELMKRAEPERVGISVGVRVFPGTELARQVTSEDHNNGLTGVGDPCEPLFFLEPEIASVVFELLDELVGADNRFLFFDPCRPLKNYNYSANQRLVTAIREGYRGAFWDILRRYE